MLLFTLFEEIRDRLKDVGRPVPQGRNLDRQHGKPGRLRFSLGDFSSLGAKQSELASPVRTRTQLLELERQQIAEALEKTNGKIYGSDGAAELLGMRPTTLSSKIAALKIKRIAR